MANADAVISAHDVAQFVLGRLGEMTTMKLQKLVYYCQAWSLVWDERPLFGERIEAWANGPVIPDLYAVHRGRFTVSLWDKGDATRFDGEAVETMDAVIGYYGDKTAQWLTDLAHDEAPWQQARAGLALGERGSQEITLASMHEYYLGLCADGEEAPQ